MVAGAGCPGRSPLWFGPWAYVQKADSHSCQDTVVREEAPGARFLVPAESEALMGLEEEEGRAQDPYGLHGGLMRRAFPAPGVGRRAISWEKEYMCECGGE